MPALGAILSAAFAWLSAIFFRIGSWMTLNFFATKFILGMLFIVVLPLILNNVLYGIYSDIFYWWLGQVVELEGEMGAMPKVFQFAGVGAYIYVKMGLADAMIIVLNACAYRFAMTLIPFVGPR